ncbi:MAG: hypothetical protein WAX04_01565 [Oscillospiraceae bacterium]
MDYTEKIRLNDREAEQLLKELLKGQPLNILNEMDKKNRDEVLRKMKGIEGCKS